MKLEYIDYVLEVAKYGSISKAAKTLYVTQPTLSIAISNLEEELGYTIFQRTSHGVTLTKEGKSFLIHAQNLMYSLNKIKNISDKNYINNKVDIMAIPLVCNKFLIELLDLSLNQYPNIRLNIKESRNNDILDNLKNKSGLYICYYTDVNKERILNHININNLEYKKLFNDYMRVFISRKDKLSYQEYIYMHELEGRIPIVFEDNESINNISGDKYSINKNNIILSDKHLIKTAIAQNLGYSILPSIMGIKDLYVQTGEIKSINLMDSNTKITTILIYDKNKINKNEKLIIKLINMLSYNYQEIINNLKSKNQDNEYNTNNEIKIYY